MASPGNTQLFGLFTSLHDSSREKRKKKSSMFSSTKRTLSPPQPPKTHKYIDMVSGSTFFALTQTPLVAGAIGATLNTKNRARGFYVGLGTGILFLGSMYLLNLPFMLEDSKPDRKEETDYYEDNEEIYS